MIKLLVTIGLITISFGSISQSVIKEIIFKGCIDDMNKLHIKNGKMAWEHVRSSGGSPPGTHDHCKIETSINGENWEEWYFNFDLDISTDSLVSSSIIENRAISRILQAPSEKNGWETIWFFNDNLPGPANYSISIKYLQKVIPNNLTFELGSSSLTSLSKKELDEISINLLKTGKSIKISGHTDSDGSVDDNLKLSTERAKTVYNYLLSKGISASKMSFQGYGGTKPLVKNDTEENKTKNRRVELLITH